MKSETGIFLKPSDEQMGKIWAACALEGFPASSEGVLQLLMLAVEPDEDSTEEPEILDPLATAAAWVRDHPEDIARAKAAGGQLLNSIFARFKPRG